MGVEESACDAPEVSTTDPSANNNIPVDVKNIFIGGLCRTQDKLVENQLTSLLKVKTYSELTKQLNSCKLKLDRIGIFKGSMCYIDAARDSDDLKGVDLVFEVKEKSVFGGAIGTEVDSSGTSASANTSVGFVNFWSGLGEQMNFSVTRATNSSTLYNLEFKKPWVENTDSVFSMNMLRSTTEFPASFYKESAHGINTNFSLPGSYGIYNLGWNLRWRENTLAANAPFEIREQCGHSLKSSLCHSFVSDGRDDYIFPTRGMLYKHGLEYSGVGGDVNALKGEVELQLNKKLFGDCVLSSSLRSSAVYSLSDTPLQINDRIFLGGPNSVRGFELNGIGEHAGEAALGGQVAWEAGLHLYTPLPWVSEKSFLRNFRLHFFANAGNLDNLENIARLRDIVEKPRTSLGLGLALNFVGFRLEVNYCVPMNVRAGDILGATRPSLALGMEFL